VQYLIATAESSGLRDASVDLCTVAQALHWFNLERFYAEVRRVLVPGGVLAVWTYSAISLDEETLDRHMQHFYSGVVGPYWPRERRLVESGYRALSFPFEDIEAPIFALQADWSLERLLGYIRTWSAVSRYTLERGDDPVIELDALLRPLWGPPDHRRRVYWPMSLRLGRKPVGGAAECG
jgi:SAM-dependent methyltransferase